MRNDGEREWNAWADMLGIEAEERVPPVTALPQSAEVATERLRRAVARGRRAELELDEVRSRELAAKDAEDDTVYVDYAADDDDDALRVAHAERPPWRHPRAVTT